MLSIFSSMDSFSSKDQYTSRNNMANLMTIMTVVCIITQTAIKFCSCTHSTNAQSHAYLWLVWSSYYHPL